MPISNSLAHLSNSTNHHHLCFSTGWHPSCSFSPVASLWTHWPIRWCWGPHDGTIIYIFIIYHDISWQWASIAAVRHCIHYFPTYCLALYLRFCWLNRATKKILQFNGPGPCLFHHGHHVIIVDPSHSKWESKDMIFMQQLINIWNMFVNQR